MRTRLKTRLVWGGLLGLLVGPLAYSQSAGLRTPAPNRPPAIARYTPSVASQSGRAPRSSRPVPAGGTPQRTPPAGHHTHPAAQGRSQAQSLRPTGGIPQSSLAALRATDESATFPALDVLLRDLALPRGLNFVSSPGSPSDAVSRELTVANGAGFTNGPASFPDAVSREITVANGAGFTNDSGSFPDAVSREITVANGPQFVSSGGSYPDAVSRELTVANGTGFVGGPGSYPDAVSRELTVANGAGFTNEPGSFPDAVSRELTVNNAPLVDVTPPDTSIVSGPAPITCDAAPTFTFTGTDDITSIPNLQYRYRVDGGAWQGPVHETTIALKDLGNGPHTFEVAAVDEAGNIDPTPAQAAFVVDRLPPVIGTPVVTAVNGASADVSWTSGKPATTALAYRLQGATDWTPSPSDGALTGTHRVRLTGLTPGKTYECQASGSDACGSSGTSPIVTFTLPADTHPPQVVIVSATACGGDATITFSGSDDVTPASKLTYRYRVDGGDWRGLFASTTVTLTGLADGGHVFEVEAIDEAGNISGPAAYSFVSDSRVLTLDNVRAAATTPTGATIRWHTNKPATSQVDYRRTSDAAWTSTSLDAALVTDHQVALSGLQIRVAYTFRIRSKDACGKEVVSPEQSFIPAADTTPPTTAITDGPSGSTCSAAVTFTYTGSDDVTPVGALRYEYSRDGAPLSAPAAKTTVTLTGLANGPHTFLVKAMDEAGNVDPVGATRAFTVAVAVPVISGVTVSAVTDGGAHFAWATDKAADTGLDYRIPGAAAWTSRRSPALVTVHSADLTGLASDTSYEYRVRSADGCGNEAISGIGTFHTLKDTTRPSVTILTGPTSILCQGDVVFTYTGSDDVTPVAGLKYRYRVDRGAWMGPFTSTTVTLAGLADGTHLFEVEAIDAAGNISAAASFSFTIDTRALVVSSVQATAITATGATVRWQTNKSATSQVDYRLTTNTAWTTTPLNTALVTDHQVILSGLKKSLGYTYRVRSKDPCGTEVVSPEAAFTTAPDTTPPTAAIASGPADGGIACDTTVTFCWTGTDNSTDTADLQYSYKMDDAAFSGFSPEPCHTFTGLAVGLHTVKARARDLSGNLSAITGRTFYVNLDPPTISNLAVTPRDYKAAFAWNTSQPTTGQVEYGLTNAYGSTSGLDGNLDGAHRIVVTGLTPLTTYHYRVHSSNGCREVVSDDAAFTTTDILKPNLVVTNITLPAETAALGQMDVTWTVQDLGPGDALAAWKDTVYLSPTAAFDAATAAKIGSYDAPGQLAELDSYTQTQTLTMPLRPAGHYFLIVVADGENAVAETNETDNALAKPIEFLAVSPFIAAPDQIALSLHPTLPVRGAIQIGNLSGAPLTGLTATVEGAPANLGVQVQLPASLETGSVATATYTVTASDESIMTAAPVLHLRSAEGPEAKVTLNLTVIPRHPQLVVTPASLETGMTRGQETMVEATITNTGSVAATGLHVVIPGAPWLSLVSPADLGDLAPGATAKVVLSLKPALDLVLGPYTGTLAANAGNGSVTIPFKFLCVSDAKGDFKAVAQDEYTFFADDKPPVAGATVTLKDAQTGAVVATGVTDDQGVFTAKGIPEGFYNLEASADKHSNANATVEIKPGQVNEVDPFLPLQLVTYTWTVTPVDTPDQYTIDLEATFETHVPAPVVTLSPAKLDLTKLVFDANGKAVVNYTITNHGLIAANGLQFNFGDNPRYHLVPAVNDLGNLAALSTIVVPVTITRVDGSLPSGKSIGASPRDTRVGACALSGGVTYYYICKDKIPRAVSCVVITDYSCLPSVIIGLTGGGGGGGGGGTITNPTVVRTIDICDPCPQAVLQTILDCLIGFTPLGSCVDSYKTIKCLTDAKEREPAEALECAKGTLELGKNIITCVTFLGEVAAFAAAPVKPKLEARNKEKNEKAKENITAFVDCAIAILETAKKCNSAAGESAAKITRNGSMSAPRSGISNTYVSNLQVHLNRLQSQIDALIEIIGDVKWLKGLPGERAVYANWFASMTRAEADDSPDGVKISASERASLLSLPRPSQLTDDDLNKCLDRWNRTVDYYKAGIVNLADVPAGQSTNFMAADVLVAKLKAANADQQADLAEGYADSIRAVYQAELDLKQSLIASQQSGVCAKVRVHLSQDVTLTRTSFKATLEVVNAPQNVPLQNVKVILDIRDGNQQPANTVFGITGPALTGVTAVDGTGMINSGTTADVIWTMTPTRDAAPTADTQYYVGGTLSYTQDGHQVTIPLFPTPITVKPDPFLQFHYFWQRDVYADDPFTPLVEPSEPFSLGLLVTNHGGGTARNLTITSGQPKIVDNEKGLLIDFKLIGTQVNTDPVSPSFTVNFGNVDPQSTVAARFLMTSSLQGRFSDYAASFKHVDDLGNPKTSLIDSVDIHELEHVVRVDVPADDGKPDFLVNDVPDPSTPADPALPDTLWSSDGTTAPVTARTDASVDGQVSDTVRVVNLTVANPPGGWLYLRLDDPALGNYKLSRVVRSDGRELKLDSGGWGNVWTTFRTIRLQGQNPYPQYRLYLFDKDSTGAYTLYYTQKDPVNAPLGALKDLADGTQVTFGVGSGAGSGNGTGTGGSGTGTGAGGAGRASGPVAVTAAFPDALYLEAQDRSAGIKAVPASGAHVGDLVSGAGTIRTDANGERYLDLTALTVVGTGPLSPLELTTKAFYGGDSVGYDADKGIGQKGMAGGAGLDPVGLLTATLGRVLSADGGTVQVDDGYGRPVKVAVPAGAAVPLPGSLIGAAGVVSMEKHGDGLYPVLRLRTPADLFPDVTGLRGQFLSPTGTLTAGDNLFSLPGVPANPAPPALLRFLDPGDGSSLIGRLNRFDAPIQSEVFWDSLGVAGPFGNFLLGEGYRLPLNAGEGGLFGFDGLRADFADLWVSLPKLGVTRIGSPFPVPVDWSQVQVTDGTKTILLRDAAQTEFPPWLRSVATYYDGPAQSVKNLGLPEDNPDSTSLFPWRGYWVTGMKDNLALIVPAHAGVPALVSLVPYAATAGGPDFFLTILGDRFTSGSAVLWNGTVRPTAWVSPQRLTAAIAAADIAAPGTATVTVATPGPYGGASNPLIFSIQAPTGPPNIIVTGAQAQRQDSSLLVDVTLQNTGVGDATSVTLAATCRLNEIPATVLPPSLGTLAANGGTTTVRLTFPGTAAVAGSRVTLHIDGTCDQGTFTGSRRLKMP